MAAIQRHSERARKQHRVELLVDNEMAEAWKRSAPEPGEYRLFVETEDGKGHVAHANLPLLVLGKR